MVGGKAAVTIEERGLGPPLAPVRRDRLLLDLPTPRCRAHTLTTPSARPTGHPPTTCRRRVPRAPQLAVRCQRSGCHGTSALQRAAPRFGAARRHSWSSVHALRRTENRERTAERDREAWCISNAPSLQDRSDKSLQHCRTRFCGTPAGRALACGTSAKQSRHSYIHVRVPGFSSGGLTPKETPRIYPTKLVTDDRRPASALR